VSPRDGLDAVDWNVKRNEERGALLRDAISSESVLFRLQGLAGQGSLPGLPF
jgi:hypothetical protein